VFSDTRKIILNHLEALEYGIEALVIHIAHHEIKKITLEDDDVEDDVVGNIRTNYLFKIVRKQLIDDYSKALESVNEQIRKL